MDPRQFDRHLDEIARQASNGAVPILQPEQVQLPRVVKSELVLLHGIEFHPSVDEVAPRFQIRDRDGKHVPALTFTNAEDGIDRTYVLNAEHVAFLQTVFGPQAE